MKYPASEKLEIIRLVEHSHLSARRTLDKIGVSRSTFHRWCDLFERFGLKGLEDRRVGPPRARNRVCRNKLFAAAFEDGKTIFQCFRLGIA